MSFVLLAMCFALPAVLLAWSYPRRAAAICTIDPAALRVAAASERLVVLKKRAAAGSWAARLAERLAEDVNDRLRLASLNELLADADHDLTRRDNWPRAAVWLCFAGSLLSAIAGYLSGARMDLVWIAPIALAAAASCIAARRAGRRHAHQQRERIDAIVKLVASDLEDADLPQRRKRH